MGGKSLCRAPAQLDRVRMGAIEFLQCGLGGLQGPCGSLESYCLRALRIQPLQCPSPGQPCATIIGLLLEPCCDLPAQNY